MHNLSMTQALSIWTDLMDAYHGDRGFNDCEIYIYRLMPYSPRYAAMRDSSAPMDEMDWEEVDRACASLLAVLEHFAASRGCSIDVDGRPLGPWVAEMRQTHRTCVSVRRKT